MCIPEMGDNIAKAAESQKATKRGVGRPKRTAPYIIPNLPADKSHLSTAEVNSIRLQRVREQNNAACQKFRQKRSQQAREIEGELALLVDKNRRMKLIESSNMSKIKKIKDFFNMTIQTECALCQKVLSSHFAQSAPMEMIEQEMLVPMVIIKEEMLDLE